MNLKDIKVDLKDIKVDLGMGDLTKKEEVINTEGLVFDRFLSKESNEEKEVINNTEENKEELKAVNPIDVVEKIKETFEEETGEKLNIICAETGSNEVKEVFDTDDEDEDDDEQIMFEAIDVSENVKKENKKPASKKTDTKPKAKEKSIDDKVKELDKIQVKVFGNEIILLEKSNGSLDDTFTTKDIQSRLIRDFGYDEFVGCEFHLIKKEGNEKEGVLVPTPKFFKKG